MESINLRIRRLNDMILGQEVALYKNKLLPVVFSREFLLDALFILYNECNRINYRKRDKNITEFVVKYRSVMDEAKSLRINNNDFDQKAVIGKGSFGTVYLVTEKLTGEVYAMKKIKKGVVSVSQIKEERDIMSRRCSKWITTLQYSFQDSDFLYLVMEYLPGGDLLSLMIRNGPFEEEWVKFYMAEIILALHDLHAMGYVHRDVKPENILVDRFGHLKIADFGNSAVIDENGHVISFSPVGTPYYIAPELLQTIPSSVKNVHDVTCDFWSVGIIGYEMIYETTPFYSNNIQETYSKILTYSETYSEDSIEIEQINFPSDIKITHNFKNLMENLINKQSQRLTYSKIITHQFFKNLKWDTLHEQTPPHIPDLKSEDDISNFENIEKKRGKQNTFLSKSISYLDLNSFCSKDLPFLGYSFIYEDKFVSDNLNETNNLAKINKLNNKIKELEIIKINNIKEITCLQEKVLSAEKNMKESNITQKILSEAKEEIVRMKERLKEKTIELSHSKTEIKTLQNSLKIEEEHRLKSDAAISEILNLTFKKWEKAKVVSDQHYEKQIGEKKMEITNLTRKLTSCEKQIEIKCNELGELNKQLDKYKQRFQNIQGQRLVDRNEFDKISSNMKEMYEHKLNDLNTRIKTESHAKDCLIDELRNIRGELNKSIDLAKISIEEKLMAEKRISEIKEILNTEIELSNRLRTENAKIELLKNDLQIDNENLHEENNKLKEEKQLKEITKNMNLESDIPSYYQSARGSLTELHKIEEQLRTDLAITKEEEDKQRNRANQLELIVSKLEDMIKKMDEQQKPLENVLEKQNEKLEDQIATIREQIVIERQSARTANLSLWKLEKKLEESQSEKTIVKRRLELTEKKIERIQKQKYDIELKVKDFDSCIKQKNDKIEELKEKVKTENFMVENVHKECQKAKEECMRLNFEMLNRINEAQSLNGKIKDLEQQLLHAHLNHENLISENNALLKELNIERNNFALSLKQTNECQLKLKSSHDSYELLKIACTITDQQLTEMEALLQEEVTTNKLNQEKITNLFKDVHTKEEEISQLKRCLNVQKLEKLEIEQELKRLQLECSELKDNIEHVHQQLISHKAQLISVKNDLFFTQEKVDLITVESKGYETTAKNFENEITILKEENSAILTELFLTKEKNNELCHQLKITNQIIPGLEEGNERLSNSLEEHKNLYTQKEIKFKATIAQHKKLIEYLQLKIEDLSQKKKSLACKLFGSSAISKKENIDPNLIESSILYRALREELNREKQKNKTLAQQIEKLLNYREIRESNLLDNDSIKNFNISCIQASYIEKIADKFDKCVLNTKFCNNLENEKKTLEKSPLNHRFELNLEKQNINVNCTVCSLSIYGSPYWFCKKCKCSVHRYCRDDMIVKCDSEMSISKHKKEIFDGAKCLQKNINYTDCVDALNLSSRRYNGDFIMRANLIDPPLGVNCACTLNCNNFLLGTTVGLFLFQVESNNLLKVNEIENVQSISVAFSVHQIILVANNGNDVLQGDLTQLHNYRQSETLIKPTFEVQKIELFNFCKSSDKYHLTEISNKQEIIVAAVAGIYQVIIMEYDGNSKNFKPIHYFETLAIVTSVVFTSHTVIISAGKFLEINLNSRIINEFIDLSDTTLSHLKGFQAMNVFNISGQEYLMCFAECGIFFDQYGCRSRPYELIWKYDPIDFLYQEPFLYISHCQCVQIVHLDRSYEAKDEMLFFKRVYTNLYMPTLLGPNGNAVILSAVNRSTNIQELVSLNGLEAFKSQSCYSLETIPTDGSYDN